MLWVVKKVHEQITFFSPFFRCVCVKCQIGHWMFNNKPNLAPSLSLASWVAALACSSQARLEQSNDSVLPVPVGDSSSPFLLISEAQHSVSTSRAGHTPQLKRQSDYASRPQTTSACRKTLFCRAVHATKLPRQRDHVFRPQNFWLLPYVFIRGGHSMKTPRPWAFTIFFMSLKLYYVFALSWSQSLKTVAYQIQGQTCCVF